MTSRNYHVVILLLAALPLSGCVYYGYNAYPYPYASRYGYPQPLYQPYSYQVPQNSAPQNYPPPNIQEPPPNPGEPTNLQPP